MITQYFCVILLIYLFLLNYLFIFLIYIVSRVLSYKIAEDLRFEILIFKILSF